MNDADARLFSKVAWRLLPVLILAYIFNYLDRNNIGFAALTMNKEIGLTATQFGRGAGILFLGYCFLEVPSNMILYRVGARRWIARIMISWGLISAATVFVTGPAQLLPAPLPARRRRGGVLSGRGVLPRPLVSGRVPHARDRVVHGGDPDLVGRGRRAVRVAAADGRHRRTWPAGSGCSFSKGLPVVVLGLVVLKVMTERPEDATWLTGEERQSVRDRVAGEKRPREVRHLGPALRDPRVLILGGVQFGFLVGSYGVGIWLPQILQAREAVGSRGRIPEQRVVRSGVDRR